MMPDNRQAADAPFSERMRLIRFRMKREDSRFADEWRVVPRWLVYTVGALYLAAVFAGVLATRLGMVEQGPGWPGGSDSWLSALCMAAAITAGAIPLAALILLTGYVNQDARRRGMNSTLWTILVAMLFPAYLVTGFVIYFLVRSPLPYHCTQCGTMVSARYNYCPSCNCNLRPTCRLCRREIGDRDRYCPYCGGTIGNAEAAAQSQTQA